MLQPPLISVSADDGAAAAGLGGAGGGVADVAMAEAEEPEDRYDLSSTQSSQEGLLDGAEPAGEAAASAAEPTLQQQRAAASAVLRPLFGDYLRAVAAACGRFTVRRESLVVASLPFCI